MAEVVGIIGLIGSIINILEGVNKTRAIFKKYVHKSSSMQKELVPVLGKLTAFTGILRGLQLECELDESDSARLKSFEHIRAPLEASEKAAKTIMARLNQVVSIGGISLAFGKVLNKEAAAALHILEQSKDVLDLALDADQRTLLKAIEKYVRTVAEDLHDMLEQGKIHYKDVKDDLKNIQLNEEEARRAKAKADLLSWVSQVNYSSNYDAAQLRTCESDQSGDWFFAGRNFRDWSKSTHRFGLLVTGISGAGKTILCSKAISHVLNDRSLNHGKANIVYFFFDFNDLAKQSVEGMVRSLIYQLVAKADSVHKTVQNLYSKHQSAPSVASPPRPEEWQKVLVALLQDTKRPFVFIDALDECAESESQDLLVTIQKLFKTGGEHVKWLLTARPSPHLLRSLLMSGFIHSYMEEGAINSDIGLHLKVRLENDAKLSSFGPKAKEMIISSITSKSAGMFRYAECQLNALSKLKDCRVKKIREILNTMPESLQSTYSKILNELHSSDTWPILERVLALVSYSARPVTIGEVAEFAILEDTMTTIQSEDRFEDFGDILSLISSLIDVQDGHLTLAHKSVQEFLNAEPQFSVLSASWWWKSSILYEGADLYIAKRCLQYLSFPQRPACELKQYRDVKSPNATHLARLLFEYPLLDYAASRWTYHVRSEEVRNIVAQEMQTTIPLTAEPNLWKAWLLLQRADIWETQVQLARLLCEVSIRSVAKPGWACNLWKVRQAYRFTIDAGKVGLLDEKSSLQHHQGGGSSSSRTLNEIRKTAGKQSHGPWMILTTGDKSLYDLAVILLEVALQTNLYSDLDLILSNISSAKDMKRHLKDMLALSKYAATIMGKQYTAVVNECLSIHQPTTSIDEFLRRANILGSQDEAMERFHAPLQSMLRSGFRASRGPVTAGHKSKVPATGSVPLASLNAPASTSSYAYYTSASVTGYGRSGTSASAYEYTESSTSGYARAATSATAYAYSAASTPAYRSDLGPTNVDGVAMSEPLPPIPKPPSEEPPILLGVRSAEVTTTAALSSQPELPPPAPALPYWSGYSEPPPKFAHLLYVHKRKQETPTTQTTISTNLSTVVEIQERSLESLDDFLLEWRRQIERGEDATTVMKENLASDQRHRQRNEGGPFELPTDEKKEEVAKKSENVAAADQDCKYSGVSLSDSTCRKVMELPSLEDENGKTVEELAFQAMRRIRKEEDGMISNAVYIPNDLRNQRKNEGGPFELASEIDVNDSGKRVDATALTRQIVREEAAGPPETTSRDDLTHVKDTEIFALKPGKEVTVNADGARSHLAPLKPVYGVLLDELFRRDNTAVPTIVYQCMQAIDLFGLDTEEIYLTSGTAAHIMAIKAMFNHGSSLVDFRTPANFHHDIASVATSLKHFLWVLPDPLLTNSQYDSFIGAARMDEDIVRRDSIHALINGLPDPNYATLRVLTFHLNRVAQHSEKNRMTVRKLAICFAPIFMRPTGPSRYRGIGDAGWQARVVETILNNAFQIFDDDE